MAMHKHSLQSLSNGNSYAKDDRALFYTVCVVFIGVFDIIFFYENIYLIEIQLIAFCDASCYESIVIVIPIVV
jgi:hypothetical protein